jgi:hypothetical protein
VLPVPAVPTPEPSIVQNSFSEDLPLELLKANAECAALVKELQFNPVLSQCYPRERVGSLFFADPETICKPECLQATIDSSKRIIHVCPYPKLEPGASDLFSARRRIYKVRWLKVPLACARLPREAPAQGGIFLLYCIQKKKKKKLIKFMVVPGDNI